MPQHKDLLAPSPAAKPITPTQLGDPSAPPWLLPPSAQLGPLPLRLHWAPSSLQLSLGQTFLCLHHRLLGLRLHLDPPALRLCRAPLPSATLQLHLDPQSHRLRLSPLAPCSTLHACCCGSTWVSTSIGLVSVSRPPGFVSQVSSMASPSLDSAMGCRHCRALGRCHRPITPAQGSSSSTCHHPFAGASSTSKAPTVPSSSHFLLQCAFTAGVYCQLC